MMRRVSTLEDLFKIDYGISGANIDLLTGQLMADGVPLSVAQAYAAILIESRQVSRTTDEFVLKKDGHIELTLAGIRAINAYRSQTSQIGIRVENDVKTTTQNSVRP